MKILVVDDEKLLVKGITFNLQNEGYEVEAAYDGATAVELARRGDFDLIILDWMMPEKSGSEAWRYAPFPMCPLSCLPQKARTAIRSWALPVGRTTM